MLVLPDNSRFKVTINIHILCKDLQLLFSLLDETLLVSEAPTPQAAVGPVLQARQSLTVLSLPLLPCWEMLNKLPSRSTAKTQTRLICMIVSSCAEGGGGGEYNLGGVLHLVNGRCSQIHAVGILCSDL